MAKYNYRLKIGNDEITLVSRKSFSIKDYTVCEEACVGDDLRVKSQHSVKSLNTFFTDHEVKIIKSKITDFDIELYSSFNLFGGNAEKALNKIKIDGRISMNRIKELVESGEMIAHLYIK